MPCFQESKGIDLREDDEIAGMIVLEDNSDLLLLSVTEEYGYGKRSSISQYRTQSEEGKEIIDIKPRTRMGWLLDPFQVRDGDRIMLITNEDQVIRISTQHSRNE